MTETAVWCWWGRSGEAKIEVLVAVDIALLLQGLSVGAEPSTRSVLEMPIQGRAIRTSYVCSMLIPPWAILRQMLLHHLYCWSSSSIYGMDYCVP